MAMLLLIIFFIIFSVPLSCNAGQNLTTTATETITSAGNNLANAANQRIIDARNNLADATVEKLTTAAATYPTVTNVARKFHETANSALTFASQTAIGKSIAESSIGQGVATISNKIPTDTLNRILYNPSSSHQKNEEPVNHPEQEVSAHHNADSKYPTHQNEESSHSEDQKNSVTLILPVTKKSSSAANLGNTDESSLPNSSESSETHNHLSVSTENEEPPHHQKNQESYEKVSFFVKNVPQGKHIPRNVFRKYPAAVMEAIEKINKEATNVEDILPKEPHYTDFHFNGLVRDRITVRISWEAEQQENGHEIVKRCKHILTEMKTKYASKGYRMLEIDAEDGVIRITCKITEFKLVPKRSRKKTINGKNN